MAHGLAEVVGGRRVGFGLGPGGFDPGRPSVVLVHGAGGSRANWSRLAGVLDAGLNVVALELPGHGESDGPAAGSVAEMASWLAGLLEAWNLDRPPVAGGHSMGGAVALELALTRPDLISGLALIGSGASMPVNSALLEGLADNFEATVRLIVKWCLHQEAPAELFEAEYRLMADNGPELLIQNFTACDGFDRSEDLARVSRPALVVCGLQDKMTPASSSEFLAAGIPEARLELIDRAGHLVMDERPDEVARVLGDFVLRLG